MDRPKEPVTGTVALFEGPLDGIAVDSAVPAIASIELGSRIAFEAAVQPLLPRLYRYALVLAQSQARADDLLQDSLVKAYLHRDAFEGRGSFVGWLLGIVRREHLEATRTAARRRSLLQSAFDRIAGVLDETHASMPSSSPEDGALAREETDAILLRLREVPEPYRTTLVLCDLEELAYDEAAEILGVPIGTVKSRHARARKKLRAIFGERGGP